MNLGDLNKVWEIKALKKPGEEEAGKILEKVAKQVQPIMKKHKWSVKLLSEFCPSNLSLLGLNVGGGVEVKLRLRSVNRDWNFIPYEQVLDTMLHELCHNEHGPHNANFYKLWEDIRKECEELIAKGVTGTGEGRRLGGFSRQPPLPALRQAALAAAEKRERLGSLLPSGPKRLGGDGDIMGALSPLQAAAMAAERRMQDEMWCGGASSSSGMLQPLPWRTTDSIAGKSAWGCGICTLLNPAQAPICEACGIQKTVDVGTKLKVWSCKFCTLDNSVRLDNCSACGQWRYSYGASVFEYEKW